ncbi:5-formyltetrahydrofolate cyclo-ligase [Coriobacteriia bacterium Es71-Z0120]|uniref:5-formyltetrahydrofolate cyclo-ligase n=1 Tax=Parvivirga hydrogeniphila TaxID=2939460 RepID=UPI002260CFC1|nr:5-formyltetrahydrofolate cyclo-ligase [Parvivirga hydrogeniphila]MCL4078241.1 5-formyltetrahydrofolate cyclo-ligase [Parvivirga hydrogeniphila]
MGDEDLARAKSVLRLRGRAARRAITPEQRAAAAERVAAMVLALPEITNARTVAAYGAMPEELDVQPLIEALWGIGVCVALPRVVSPTDVSLHRYRRGDELCRGPYGLKEPCPDAPAVAVEDVDAFVVPGVAFDLACNRLGMGAGYYDRLLAKARPDARIVGVAYDEQIFISIPCTPNDRPVDVLVTPRGVFRHPGRGLTTSS